MSVKITCSDDGQVIEFQEGIQNFVEATLPETLTIPTDEATLTKIKNLLEVHSYDVDQIQVNTPVLSLNLAQNMDEKSYNILKEENEDSIRPVLEVAEILNMTKIKELCVACIDAMHIYFLGCEFFVGDREAFLQRFKEKYGMDQLDKDEEDEIIAQSEASFYDLYQNTYIDKQEEQKNE